MNLPKLLTIAIFAAIAFAAGVISQRASAADTGDWLSFGGALLGSALTVAGGIAILEWQRTSELRARRALLVELLDEVDAACVPFQVANEPALRERYGKTAPEQVRELRAAIRRVHAFRATMVPKTAAMMKAADVLTELNFDNPEVEGWLTGIAFYPADADFGGLNMLGHEVTSITNAARKLLKD